MTSSTETNEFTSSVNQSKLNSSGTKNKVKMHFCDEKYKEWIRISHANDGIKFWST